MMDVAALKEMLLALALSMARIMAAFSVLPFMSTQLISGVIRNSIVLSFALVVYPVVAPTLPHEPMSLPFLAMILGKEIIIGVLLGFLAGIIFWVAESVGFFIDNQRGAAMASLMDPLYGSQTSPLGSMFLQMVTVLFFTCGGFLILLSGLFESFRLWPVFSFFPHFGKGFSLFFLEKADLLMQLTVILAAPIIIAVFAAEFGLGLINRFAPQLNVFFLSMPIKSGIASLLLVLYLSFLVYYFKGNFGEMKTLLHFLGNVIDSP
jgi:type III secretion protein T